MFLLEISNNKPLTFSLSSYRLIAEARLPILSTAGGQVKNMEKTIKALIYFDGEHHCAKCFEIDVFTQGKTIDETIKNLKEAISVHLDGVDPTQYGLIKKPGLLIMMESDLSYSYA